MQQIPSALVAPPLPTVAEEQQQASPPSQDVPENLSKNINVPHYFWKKVASNLPFIIHSHASGSTSAAPSLTERMHRLLFNTVELWKAMTSFSSGSPVVIYESIEKLKKLIHFLRESKEVHRKIKTLLKILKTMPDEQKLKSLQPLLKAQAQLALKPKRSIPKEEEIEGQAEDDNTPGTLEKLDDFSTVIISNDVAVGVYSPKISSMMDLLGILQALDSLNQLQEGIEEFIDNRKIISKIDRVYAQLMRMGGQAEIAGQLLCIKSELAEGKARRKFVGTLIKAPCAIISGTSETTAAALTLAGQAAAVPLEILSGASGVLEGSIQAGCSLRNIYKAAKVALRIRKIKKEMQTRPSSSPSSHQLLIDFLSQEKFKANVKLGTNVASGVGGAGAVALGITSLVLLAATPLSVGITLPLGLAAAGFCLGGLAVKYATIHILNKKQKKRFEKHPTLAYAALFLRLLQLLDKQSSGGPQQQKKYAETVDLFLKFFKSRLGEEKSRAEQLKALQQLLIIEMALFSEKDFPSFNTSWKILFNSNFPLNAAALRARSPSDRPGDR